MTTSTLSYKSPMYDAAMKAAKDRTAQSKKRTVENLSAVIGWLDTTEALAQGMVSGGGGGSGGQTSGHEGLGGSIRNVMEGRGRSTGATPPLKTWHWRDPIDNQRFTATTAKGTKKSFKGLLNHLARVGYDVDSIGSYANRNVAGTNTRSEHSYGRAIDINPAQNPMGSRLVTDMPKNTAAIAELYDLIWGGTWKSKKDAMHFSTTGY